MRNHTLAAVIACILGIVALVLLGLFLLLGQQGTGLLSFLPGGALFRESEQMTESFSGFILATEAEGPSQAPVPAALQEGPGQTLPAAQTEPETAQPLQEEEPVDGSSLPSHRILFVGDSRTLGMRDALQRAGREDDDVFVGRVGEGLRWFLSEGKSEMNAAIAGDPSLPVVLNFGVNDPLETDNYIVAYWDCIREHPDTRFFILSVNPLDEQVLLEDDLVPDPVLEEINSLNISRMNVRLKEEFGERFLDSSSFLKENGYTTVDGLHYSTDTYLAIHDFVVRSLYGSSFSPEETEP